MATKTWVGGAASINQVTRITWDAYTSGVTYIVTCNGKNVEFLATASTEDNVVDGLVTAIGATTEPEFAEFAASNATADGLTLTGNTGGYPFTVTASSDLYSCGFNFRLSFILISGNKNPSCSERLDRKSVV